MALHGLLILAKSDMEVCAIFCRDFQSFPKRVFFECSNPRKSFDEIFFERLQIVTNALKNSDLHVLGLEPTPLVPSADALTNELYTCTRRYLPSFRILSHPFSCFVV